MDKEGSIEYGSIGENTCMGDHKVLYEIRYKILTSFTFFMLFIKRNIFWFLMTKLLFLYLLFDIKLELYIKVNLNFI